MPERCARWCIGIGAEVIRKPKCKPCVVIQVLAMCCHRAHPGPLLQAPGEGESFALKNLRLDLPCGHWQIQRWMMAVPAPGGEVRVRRTLNLVARKLPK